MFAKPWWEDLPARLEWELGWLSHAGYKYKELSRNEVAGTLELLVEYPVNEVVLKLRVLFPPFFPGARFEVYTDDLKLAHHQNPYTKGLCLLGRSTALWDPNTSLASFLTVQMPMLLKSGQSDDSCIAAPLEEPQGEPTTAFLPYLDMSAILLDERAEVGSAQSGKFSANISIAAVADNISVRGIIGTIDDQSLWTPTPESVKNTWRFDRQVSGRWFNVSKLSLGLNAKQFVEEVSKEHPTVLSSSQQFDYLAERCEIIGFLIPSEIGHRVKGREWVLVLRRKSRNSSRRKPQRVRYDFVRLERFGRELMYQRSPELKGLSTKCVAVVGLGCIGAPSAIEFARAAVGELRLLDADIVEAATVVRWPLGLPAVGHQKANVIAQFIQHNFPLAKVDGMIARIGPPPEGEMPSVEQWRSFFKGVDLLFDATAEMGVSSILSHIATELGIPLICVSATHGGWGGMIVTSDSGKSGCYDCFLRYFNEGAIPRPPESPAPRVQTSGCADPTYTAAAFDTTELAITGVRTAVSLLTRDAPDAYPLLPCGVGILSLRDQTGASIYPQWQHIPLTVHPECPCH